MRHRSFNSRLPTKAALGTKTSAPFPRMPEQGPHLRPLLFHTNLLFLRGRPEDLRPEKHMLSVAGMPATPEKRLPQRRRIQ